MANVTLTLYPQAIAKMLNKEIDWDTDSVKATLHTVTYSPAAADDYFNDATNELGTASGYTAGGVAIANRSISVVAANSWGTTWAAATAYRVGDIRRPTTGNGFVYRCSVAGTSHASTEPTWPTTVGREVTDNTVVWTCVGSNVVRLIGDPISWGAPFGAGPFRRLVIRSDTGTPSTSPLIGYISYGSDQTGGDGSFTVTPNNTSYFDIPV